MLLMLLHVYYHLNHVDVQVGQINNHKEDDFWRAPKSWGETHLRVSQSQVAEIVT
jgi:hypothetical protein